MKRPDGVTIIAIYHFVVAVPLLIGACAIIGVPVSGALSDADQVGRFWALFGLGVGFLFVLGSALLGIGAGWGLLRLKGWARWLTVILSVLALPLFPIGTLIGALIIWYLLQDRVRLAFEPGGTGALAANVSSPVDASEADLPYVIGPEVDEADLAETVLDVEADADEPATLVSESQALVEELEDEAAAPETIILSEEELAEAQEDDEEADKDQEAA